MEALYSHKLPLKTFSQGLIPFLDFWEDIILYLEKSVNISLKKILILHNLRETTCISHITDLRKEATFHARKVHICRYIFFFLNWIVTCFCHSSHMINNSYKYWIPSLENRFALPVCSTEISIFVALYFYYFNSKIANESKTTNTNLS